MCDEKKELICLYIDGQLDQADEKILMNHMDTCSDCQSYYNDLKHMVKELNSLGQFDLPENFHKEAMEKIKNISKPSVRKGIFIPLIKYACAAASFAFLLTAISIVGSFVVETGDGSTEFAQENYSPSSKAVAFSSIAVEEADTVADVAEDSTLYMLADEAEISPQAANSQIRLMVEPVAKEVEASALMSNNYYIEIQSDQFEMAIDIINGLDASVINSGIYYDSGNSRTANFYMNISVSHADTTLAVVRSLGEVVNESNSSSALKQQYDDTSVRISAKEQERHRLLALMEKTKTMENLLLLENRLSQVETELDYLNSSIKSYVNISENSSLNLVINEKIQPVITYEDKGFLQRVKDSFINSINITGVFFERFLVITAGSIIPLCVVAVLGGSGFMAYKLKKRKEHKS